MNFTKFDTKTEMILTVVLILIVIAVTVGMTISMYRSVQANIAQGELSEEVIIEDEDREFGEIFERDGMLCADFIARSYDFRKEIGITCLAQGNFITIAPVVMHPENQQELVGVQARIRREAITRGGW